MTGSEKKTDQDVHTPRLGEEISEFVEQLARQTSVVQDAHYLEEKNAYESGIKKDELRLEEVRHQLRAEEVRRESVRTDSLVQDLDLRAKYAAKAFGLAGWAVWFWICMFTAVGISNAALGKPVLSDNALITLTTGATVNVIAICLVVVRGLFPKPTA